MDVRAADAPAEAERTHTLIVRRKVPLDISADTIRLMARLVVWAQGREWTVDAPEVLDLAELARGLAGESVSHVNVTDWLDAHQRWLPTPDGVGSNGRVRRDAIIGAWVEDR